MLIETIQFEIHNFLNNTSDEYTIENTIENQEMVLGHRFTRQIHFVKMYDFQYEKEMRLPVEFLSPAVFITMFADVDFSFLEHDPYCNCTECEKAAFNDLPVAELETV